MKCFLLLTLSLLTSTFASEEHCETEKCGISKNQDWVLMVSVSKAYDQFFQNWLIHFEKLKLDMKLFVFAEDEYIVKKYSNFTSFTLKNFQFSEVYKMFQIGKQTTAICVTLFMTFCQKMDSVINLIQLWPILEKQQMTF